VVPVKLSRQTGGARSICGHCRQALALDQKRLDVFPFHCRFPLHRFAIMFGFIRVNLEAGTRNGQSKLTV
jgi:hypothetical protein